MAKTQKPTVGGVKIEGGRLIRRNTPLKSAVGRSNAPVAPFPGVNRAAIRGVSPVERPCGISSQAFNAMNGGVERSGTGALNAPAVFSRGYVTPGNALNGHPVGGFNGGGEHPRCTNSANNGALNGGRLIEGNAHLSETRGRSNGANASVEHPRGISSQALNTPFAEMRGRSNGANAPVEHPCGISSRALNAPVAGFHRPRLASSSKTRRVPVSARLGVKRSETLPGNGAAPFSVARSSWTNTPVNHPRAETRRAVNGGRLIRGNTPSGKMVRRLIAPVSANTLPVSRSAAANDIRRRACPGGGYSRQAIAQAAGKPAQDTRAEYPQGSQVAPAKGAAAMCGAISETRGGYSRQVFATAAGNSAADLEGAS